MSDPTDDIDSQLDALLLDMPREKAPAALRRRLLQIPAATAEPSPWWQMPWLRGGMVLASLGLVLLVANLGGPDRDGPSDAEIEQGRRDLVLALSYVSQATTQAHQQIDRRLNQSLVEPVSDNTVRALGQTLVLNEEYKL